MAKTSSIRADDELFAAKGRAAPLDKTRAAIVATEPAVAADNGTAPLPGIFTEEIGKTEPDGGDGTPARTDAAEPPPAASLLTIMTQGSAARSRMAARTLPEPIPEPDGETGDAAPVSEPDTAAEIRSDAVADAPSDAPVHLPVPVRTNLPAVVAAPPTPKAFRYRKAALLAASVAVVIAGSIAFFTLPEPAPPPAALPGSPPIAAADTAPVLPPAPEETPGAAPAPAIVPQRPKAEIASVHVDNAGRVIVNGAAPPDTELIVLRNRQPLGTARSDTGGRWSFSARVPTRTERHEISVVPLQIDTRVLVEQPSFVPRPGRRPAAPPLSGKPAGRSYFAQIASLPSAADAGREAAKLSSKLSGVFAAHRIAVRSATIEQGRTVYRVAIAGFATKENAADACARIRALNTHCLVMQEP